MKAILAVLLAPLSAVSAVPESSSDRFDFTETLWIYHMVDGGGIIYQAPIEYHPENSGSLGSVIVYEALDQYMAELGDPHKPDFFIQPGEGPVLDKFVFVTGVSQKTYLLKENWLGDGKKWVPMHPEDYNNLRSMIDQRRAGHGNLNPVEALEKKTAEVHSAGQQDVTPAWQPVQAHQEETPTEDSAINERPPRTSGAAVTANSRHQSESDHLNEDNLKGQSEKRFSTDKGVAIKKGEAEPRSASIAMTPFSPDQGTSIGDKQGSNASPDQSLAAAGKRKNGSWSLVAIFSIVFLGYFLYIRKKH